MFAIAGRCRRSLLPQTVSRSLIKPTHISLDADSNSRSSTIRNSAMAMKSRRVLREQPASRNVFAMLQLFSLKICSTLWYLSLSNRKQIGVRQLECFFEQINRMLNLTAQIKLLQYFYVCQWKVYRYALSRRPLRRSIFKNGVFPYNFLGWYLRVREQFNSNPWQTFGSILLNCNFDFNFFFSTLKQSQHAAEKLRGFWSSASSEDCLNTSLYPFRWDSLLFMLQISSLVLTARLLFSPSTNDSSRFCLSPFTF